MFAIVNTIYYLLGMDYSSKQKPKKSHKVIKFWGVFILLIACGVLAGLLYIRHDTKPQISYLPATKQKVNVVQSDQVFATDYFEFSVDEDWRQVETRDTNGDVYQYTQYNNELPTRHLKVYINPTNARYQVPYILPAIIQQNSIIAQGPIAEHCRQQGINDFRVGERVTIQDGVEFLCDVDATDNRVAVGFIDNGIVMPYISDVHGEYGITIEYKDVSFTRDDRIFNEILKSFRLR